MPSTMFCFVFLIIIGNRSPIVANDLLLARLFFYHL